MGRQPCCDKVGLKRGPWTIEEDHKLINFVLNNGIHCWRAVPKLAGLLRCGKSCRLRWINYLRPDLKRGALSESEEDQIIQLHARLGNRWSKIASHFPGRTDNEIKNHWNTRIKKRLKALGLDPVTHKPVEQNEIIDEYKTETTTTATTEPDSIITTTILMTDINHDVPETSHDTQNEAVKMTTTTTTTTTTTSINSDIDGGSSVLHNYEMLCGSSLDVGCCLWMNQETNSTSTSTSTPFSLEEYSLNPSMAEYSASSIQLEDHYDLQQWVDTTTTTAAVDSINFSWNSFNQFLEEEEHFFLDDRYN